MKLTGDIEIGNRLLPSLNMSRRRPERSQLSIGIFPCSKQPEPFMILQTLKNGTGVKYKVKGNVESIFARFVGEGKATIRLKEPPHDLIIKSKPQELKGFLNALKHCLSGSADLSKSKLYQLSNLAALPTKVAAKPKMKLVVNSKKEYPQLEGFPRTLETLQLNNLELRKLDGRILRLQNLQILNLECNDLEDLPKELDLLPNLSELYLARNHFSSQLNKWSWLQGTNIRRKLQLLDLSSNELLVLPDRLVKLSGLKTLILSNNSLWRLPNGIGLMSNLRVLHANNNCIQSWPGSMRLLKLDLIDVSLNSGSMFIVPIAPAVPFSEPKTLLDLSAQRVLGSRLPFSDETIPRTLADYLENACYCDCGKPTFPCRPEASLRFNMKRIATSVTYCSRTVETYIRVRFCSRGCWQQGFEVDNVI